MIALLTENSLLLLFLIAGIGYLLGRIKIGGSSLGVAAVLFVGLGFGALDPDLKLPEIIYLLGLVLFVYTIGLSSGPTFFSSLRGSGLRDNLLVAAALISGFCGLATLWIGFRLLHIPMGLLLGVLAGLQTQPATLGYALEQSRNELPNVGYATVFPLAVIIKIVVAQLLLILLA